MDPEQLRKLHTLFDGDPHIDRIIDPEPIYIPPFEAYDLSFSPYTEEQKEMFRNSIRALHEFIGLPYRIDRFTDDHARDKWRMEHFTDPDHWDLYNENALRLDSLGVAVNSTSFISNRLVDPQDAAWTNRFQQAAQAVIEPVYKRVDAYKGLGKYEQVAFVRDIKGKVHDFLWHLALKPIPTTPKARIIPPDARGHATAPALQYLRYRLLVALGTTDLSQHDHIWGMDTLPYIRGYVRDGFLQQSIFKLLDIDPEGEAISFDENALNWMYQNALTRQNQ